MKKIVMTLFLKWTLLFSFAYAHDGHDVLKRVYEVIDTNQHDQPEFIQNINSALFRRQWGLRNTGQTLLRSSGELTRERLNGLQGRDIDWVWDLEEFQTDVSGERKDVVVAVIDSGVDTQHPKLRGKIWSDPECPEGQVCQGFNFLRRNFDVTDETGHGTHVAGIIASKWEGSGVWGVLGENVQIMPLKVLSPDLTSFTYEGRLVTDLMAEAIRFARLKGADVINMSLGWPQVVQTPRFQREVELALEANIPIIVAAGNNRKNIPTYPCTMKQVICVGAVDNRGKLTDFSNYGGKIDLLAPGESIISLFPTNLESKSLRINGHEVKRGTSQAAPFVSAIAASLKVANPSITVREIKARLYQSAKQEPSTKGISRFGLVSMRGALSLSPENFVRPLFKDLLEVKVTPNGNYSFNLPIVGDFLTQENFYLSIQIKNALGEKQLLMDRSVELMSAKEININVEGVIDNLELDSHMLLKVVIAKGDDYKKILSETSTDLVFSLVLDELSEDIEKIEFPNQEISSEILRFQGEHSLSRLLKVDDPHRLYSGLMYFYPKTRQTGGQDIYFYNINPRGESEQRILALRETQRVFSVLLTQFDGRDVLMIYSQQDRENLLLSFYDFQTLTPLYDELSHWRFPITPFGGLPVDAGKHEFSWFLKDSEVFSQKIPVPVFVREDFLPQEDNSQNPMLRMARQRRNHLFYLEPFFDSDGGVSLRRRVLDNFEKRTKWRNRLNQLGDGALDIMEILPQNLNDLKSFRINAVISTGELFHRKVEGLVLSKNVEHWLDWADGNLFLDTNRVYPVETLGPLGDRNLYSFVSTFDRQRARFAHVDSRMGAESYFNFESPSWSDQIFRPISSFHGTTSVYHFLESRFHLYALKYDSSSHEGQAMSLPINRDSAFPGVQFAETFSGQRIAMGGELRPAVFVNSRLIFGNLIYSMLVDPLQGFIRPISLSWQLPRGCVPMDFFEKQRGDFFKSYFTLLCQNPVNGKTFWLLKKL